MRSIWGSRAYTTGGAVINSLVAHRQGLGDQSSISFHDNKGLHGTPRVEKIVKGLPSFAYQRTYGQIWISPLFSQDHSSFSRI